MTPLTQVVFVNDEVTISFLRKSQTKVVFSLTGNKWIREFCENSLTRRGVPFSNVPNTSCQRPSDKHVENNDDIYMISYFSNHVSSKTCFFSLFRDLSWKMRWKAHDLCAARHGHQSLIITLVYSYPTPRPLWDVCKTRKRFFSLRVVMKKSDSKFWIFKKHHIWSVCQHCGKDL